MNIGIIGAGTIGKKHAEAAQRAGADIGWVIDIDQQLGSELAEECGARCSASPNPLWEDDSVAAVVIGVPNWLHMPLAVAALSAGKDVLLEKPMALNVEECQTIARVADDHGRVLQIGYAHRYKIGRAHV